MDTTARKSFWCILALMVTLVWSESSALIIYRFGGASEPPPPEVDGEGVRFIQRDWSELDAARGGEIYQLDMDDSAIRALRYDPKVNIAPTYEARGGHLGGSIWAAGDKYIEAFDGDLNTSWMASRYLCAEFRFTELYGSVCDGYAWPGDFGILLGGLFYIDRIVIVSGLEDPGATVRNIRINLGGQSGWGTSSRGTTTIEIQGNREQRLVVPIDLDWRIEHIPFTLGEHNHAWEVVEVEVYAKGFVDKSSYVSDIVDFGGPAAWGEMRWSGFKDAGAKLFIQTRSGADDDPDLYWKIIGRGDDKVVVTQSEYKKLKIGERGRTTYDRDSWTLWSAPYDFADSAGAAVVSLSPRQYLQFKVDFIPEDESGGGLDFLELRASTPPVASELLGEIFPYEVEVGQASRFTYVLKPTLKGDDTGFDRLEMTSSASRVLSVDSVRVDNLDVPFEMEAQDEHRFEISFPKIVREEDSGALIEVVFNAQVLRYGSTFNARVFDSSRPLEVPQGVSAGDATDDFDGNTVSVATSIDSRSLLETSVSSRIFTPNGDGVNDTAYISYDLFESLGMVSTTIEIRDLAGRLVRQVYTGEDRIGHYEREWDGTDDAGELVLPGVYVYRAAVDADRKRVDRIGTIHVAY